MSTAEAIGYRYYPQKTGLTEAQINCDSFFVQAICLYILWIIYQPPFETIELLMGICISMCMVIGTTMLTFALNVGQGGPVMAIDSCKALVIVAFNVLAMGILPTEYQFAGMALGIIGASVVGMGK